MAASQCSFSVFSLERYVEDADEVPEPELPPEDTSLPEEPELLIGVLPEPNPEDVDELLLGVGLARLLDELESLPDEASPEPEPLRMYGQALHCL